MVQIRKMLPSDWPEVAAIYTEGLRTNIATLQTECPDYPQWDASHLQQCRLVAVDGGRVLGWAALTPASGRCVYAGVAEVSIYIAGEYRGKGIGSLLLSELITDSEREGLWTLQSGILPENTASAKLHEKCGFRLVGVRERIGRDRFGIWHDTLLMERRSSITGR